MKKSRFRRMIILVLTVITVFSFATTAFAGVDVYWYNKEVCGGPSQPVGSAIRSEVNSMDVDPFAGQVNWNGQSSWKFRGYTWGETKTTELKSIYGDGYYCAGYITASYCWMYMMMSIGSSNTNDKLTFSGYGYF